MTPLELNDKYLKNISKLDTPEDLIEIREELAEFTIFNKQDLESISLSNEDQNILFELGLPSEYKTGIIFNEEYPTRTLQESEDADLRQIDPELKNREPHNWCSTRKLTSLKSQ